MSWWDAWFGTATEKKREQYKSLYNDLKAKKSDFNSRLKTMKTRVSNYESNRPGMSESFIPEDVFSVSEKNVGKKVNSVKDNQSADAKALDDAVDAAYQRYRYYAQLAEQERVQREAEARRQRERQRQAAEARRRKR